MSLFATSVTPAPTPLEHLLDHQEALRAAGAEVHRLQGLIDTQAVQAAQRADSSALDTTKARRLEVLADLAEGRATQEDLKAAERAIAQADIEARQQQRLPQQAADMAQALRPRLEAAQADLRRLQAQTPEHLQAVLLAEAEALGREYVAHAKALADAWTRLYGVQQLLKRHVPKPAPVVTLLNHDVLAIPAVAVGGCPREGQSKTLWLDAERLLRQHPNPDTDEAQRLRAKGVKVI